MVQAQDGIQLSVVVIAVAMQDGLAGPGQRTREYGLDEAGAADDDVVPRFGQPLLVEIGIYRWRLRDVVLMLTMFMPGHSHIIRHIL